MLEVLEEIWPTAHGLLPGVSEPVGNLNKWCEYEISPILLMPTMMEKHASHKHMNLLSTLDSHLSFLTSLVFFFLLFATWRQVLSL